MATVTRSIDPTLVAAIFCTAYDEARHIDRMEGPPLPSKTISDTLRISAPKSVTISDDLGVEKIIDLAMEYYKKRRGRAIARARISNQRPIVPEIDAPETLQVLIDVVPGMMSLETKVVIKTGQLLAA